MAALDLWKIPPPPQLTQEILGETYFRELDILQDYRETEITEIWVVTVNVLLLIPADGRWGLGKLVWYIGNFSFIKIHLFGTFFPLPIQDYSSNCTLNFIFSVSSRIGNVSSDYFLFSLFLMPLFSQLLAHSLEVCLIKSFPLKKPTV